MRFVLWATLGYVAVAATANLASRRPAPSVDAMIRRAHIQMVAELAAGVVLAAAHWQLGRRLTFRGGSFGETVRRVYRFGVAGFVVSEFTVVALRLAAGSAPGVVLMSRWAGTLAFAVAGVAAVSFLAYARTLARRIPSDRLAHAAGRLMWSCGGSMAVYVTLAVMWITTPPGRLSPVVLVMLAASSLAATAFLLTAAGAMMLLHRLRVAFTRAVRAAAAGIATTTPGATGPARQPFPVPPRG
jgi:hypothetical protein